MIASTPTRFRWLERGDGEPVVMLHGLMGEMDHWESTLEALGPFRRPIALELPIFDPALTDVSLPALADYPLGELRAAFESNVIVPIALIKLFLPSLRARGGAVLNVTSDAAVEPYAGWGGYGAVKAALEQASNVLATEETAIRVWWVDPGDLRTDMHQAAFPGEDISDRPLPESVVPAFLRLVAERLPSGRYRAAELS